jgi:hypothetical protein
MRPYVDRVCGPEGRSEITCAALPRKRLPLCLRLPPGVPGSNQACAASARARRSAPTSAAIAGFVQPPGSAEAGWQLCERVVDSEEPRGGDFLGRDPFGKGDLGGSVGARGSVLLVDGSQAFLGEAVCDTNESWP